jgi:hypothetical protein
MRAKGGPPNHTHADFAPARFAIHSIKLSKSPDIANTRSFSAALIDDSSVIQEETRFSATSQGRKEERKVAGTPVVVRP